MVTSNILQKFFLLIPFAHLGPQTPAPDTGGGSSSDWNYFDTGGWGDFYPDCNGNRQSPIHIKTSLSYILPIPPIKFGNYEIPLDGDLTLRNNGHSVEFDVPITQNGRRPYIRGGIMKSKYEAVGVHFHWGNGTNKGSEHMIDNRRYDVEMHIVHKNVAYETVDEATQHKDGLAVLGVMFKIVNGPDRYYPGLNKIFNRVPLITEYQSSALIQGYITLGQLLGDLDTKNFYTYSGSLTTPGCAQAVTWNVFPQPLPISAQNIRQFWFIRDDTNRPLTNNYRPIQPRNRRPVFYRLNKNAFSYVA